MEVVGHAINELTQVHKEFKIVCDILQSDGECKLSEDRIEQLIRRYKVFAANFSTLKDSKINTTEEFANGAIVSGNIQLEWLRSLFLMSS
jgi:hypothetical protein